MFTWRPHIIMERIEQCLLDDRNSAFNSYEKSWEKPIPNLVPIKSFLLKQTNRWHTKEILLSMKKMRKSLRKIKRNQAGTHMTDPNYQGGLKILIFLLQKIHFVLCVWLFRRKPSYADMWLKTYFQWLFSIIVKNLDGGAEDVGWTLKY